MPAFYAHHSFGSKVAEQLGGELKDIVEKYRPQFNIGLQGPDLFFFYKPYRSNSINKYGNALHCRSAYPFLNNAIGIISKKGRNCAEYAYILGFTCHFILDSECHPYIDEMIKLTGVSHIEIEEEFEKHMLRRNGRDPIGYPIWRLVPKDRSTAEAILPFYEVSLEEIKKSLSGLKLVKHLFTAPCPVKQAVINTSLKAVGKYDKYKGLMNQRIDNPACAVTNAGLSQRLDSAVDIALQMIESLDESIRLGTALDNRFDRTFL